VTDVIHDRLQQLNLLLSQSQSFKAQFYPTLMITALLGLGITKIFVGISRGKPVGYLFILCSLIGIIGFMFFLVPPHRSRYGDRVLESLRSRTCSRLYGNLDPQLPLAFALFGTTILAGDALADLKKVLAPPPSNDGVAVMVVVVVVVVVVAVVAVVVAVVAVVDKYLLILQ
jgi:glucan phosphoethanolaminetransferase (alkaline phosphatase superfamily)